MELSCLIMGNAASAEGVLLLHGFGADRHDLAGLAGELDPSGRLAWYLPDAPYGLPWGGRAWFPADSVAASRAMESGYFDELTNQDDPGRIASLEYLEAICKSAPHTIWHLAGFSQGSMMALHLAARNSFPVGKVMLFSSAPFALPALETSLAGKPASWSCLQTHGTMDPVLDIRQARILHARLEAAGISCRLHEFQGFHEISRSCAALARDFLSAGPSEGCP